MGRGLRSLILRLLLLVFLCPAPGLAQNSATLDVGSEVHVTADDPTGVYVEPMIAVDPSDSSRMAVAAIHLRDPRADRWQDRQTIAVYASRDGGRSWSRRDLERLPDDWFAGDPWLAWGPGSNLYLTAIVGESLTEAGALQYTALFRSPDGGWTWPDAPQRPFRPGTYQDHPVVLASRADLAVVGTVADGTAEGVYVTRCEACATDEPGAWGSTERLVVGASQINLGGAVLLLHGSIVVSYYTMSTPRHYWTQRMSPAGDAPGLRAEDILPLGFPAAAAEPLGDRVVTVWVESIDAAWRLRTASSDDGGRSWGPAVDIPVSEEGSLPMMPVIAVSPDGYVVATWQEQRPGSDCMRLFASASSASTREFTAARSVSRAASCSATAANGAAAHRFRLGGGDYMGLVPIDGGQFQAVWADSRDGTFQIYTARLHLRPEAGDRPSGQ